MKKIILLLVLSVVILSACNDDFLEKAPINSQTEGTAFVTYENFQTYAWSLYPVFTNAKLGTQGIDNGYYRSRGDELAGYLSNKGESASNDYGTQNVTINTGNDRWSFVEIRRANIMIQNIANGEITDAQKEHWEGVGRFFRAYSYLELISSYGDIPWIDRAATSENDDEIVYADRTPRVIVADNIVKDLEFAIEHIDNTKDGANTISSDCAKALLSRFGLFEGTWRKYHQTDESAAEFKSIDLLNKAAKASKELIAAYPTIDEHFNSKLLSMDLSNKPGIILYQEYLTDFLGHSMSRYENNSVNRYETDQTIVDMYLCRDGKTISHSSQYGGAKKSIYNEFRNRDARLLLTFNPPYYDASSTAPYVKNVKFTPPADLNIDPMEYQSVLRDLTPNTLWTQIPVKNWDNKQKVAASPSINGLVVGYGTSRSGYTFSRHCTYEDDNFQGKQGSDKPIFYIEEIMLNYAEIMYELDQFDQAVAAITINPLRKRARVEDMTVEDIDDSFDPKRDVTVSPKLWEIRRERMVELMGEGFGFNDIRRWKKAEWFINRPMMGMYMRHSDHSDATGKPHAGYGKILLTIDGNTTTAAIKEGYVYRFPNPKTILGKGWKDTYYLFPVPLLQIQLTDNKLKQNPGWDKI